ncbi:hypothetical protein J437_LFUL011652 [Ladona fulva]|uniref:Cytidine deaminase n=1 Tax=Ladona fulva TaxID=123851 RepID=A0A8K0KEB1_LADFU|nr:hypothetical protein J437_LFUL011652 [Ladona fulva]
MPLSKEVAVTVPYDKLDQTAKDLIDAALSARGFAYCPYSKFGVGAAVAWSDAEGIDKGCNVENATYGNTICAERNAITTGVTQGKRKLKAIGVVAEMNDSSDFVSPCGPCRQFIYEFGNKVDVYMAKVSSVHGDVLVSTADQLLPLGFRLN